MLKVGVAPDLGDREGSQRREAKAGCRRMGIAMQGSLSQAAPLEWRIPAGKSRS